MKKWFHGLEMVAKNWNIQTKKPQKTKKTNVKPLYFIYFPVLGSLYAFM